MEYLPSTVKIQREILIKSDTPGGVLRNLSGLLNALTRDKITAAYMHHLFRLIEAENAAFKDNVENASAWMFECLQKLKKSIWIENSFIKPIFLNAESTISEKKYDLMSGVSFCYNSKTKKFDYSLGKGFIEVALEQLQAIAHQIASFGEAILFEGWAKLSFEQITHSPFYYEYLKERIELSSESKVPISASDIGRLIQYPRGRIPMNDTEKKKFFTLLKRGVSDWIIHPIMETKLIGSHKKQIQTGRITSIGEMRIDNFMYPRSLEEILLIKSPRGRAQKKEKLSSDPVTLLGFLCNLKRYENFEPATWPPKEPLRNWDDVEKYLHQADWGYYLSGFESDDERRHPYGLNDLIRIVDTFLNMVSAHVSEKNFLKGPKKKGFNSKKALEFAVREIKEHIRSISEEERCCFDTSKRRPHILKRADEVCLDEDIKKAITKTLVNETASSNVRNELIEEGIDWKIPSGRPRNKPKIPAQTLKKTCKK